MRRPAGLREIRHALQWPTPSLHLFEATQPDNHDVEQAGQHPWMGVGEALLDFRVGLSGDDFGEVERQTAIRQIAARREIIDPGQDKRAAGVEAGIPVIRPLPA